MFDFNNDGNFDVMDLIEADIEYGLFEEDNKYPNQQIKKPKQKTFWDIFKIS